MRNKICEGDGLWHYPKKDDAANYDEVVFGLDWSTGYVLGYKPNRWVRCPKCGRRVKMSVRTNHDGDVIWRIPPHKVKEWWKRRVKKCER